MNIDKTNKIRFLKLSYLVGGVYDLLLGLTLVIGLTFTSETLSELFTVALPQPLLFGQVTGLFLIAVGYYLVVASQAPEHYIFIGVGSVFVRLSYGLIILMDFTSIKPLYTLLGVTDTLTGLLILVALAWYKY